MSTRTTLLLLLACLICLSSPMIHPAQAGFDEGPWLQNVTGTSVEILYEGDDDDSNGVVEYGETPAYGDSVGTVKRFAFDEYYIG